MAGGGNVQIKSTKLQGIQVQSSVYGAAITRGWGTFRTGVNLLWYGGFRAIAQKQKSSGGKGGGGSVSQTTYRYEASVVLAIGAGPIAGVRTLYRDKEVLTGLSGSGLSLVAGSIGQAAWGYLTTSFPDQAIGYSGLAYLYGQGYRLSDQATLQNHSVEVQSTTRVTGLDDANPKDIVTEFLSLVPQWGGGLTGDLSSYGNYCLAAGLLLSPVLDSQTPGKEFLEEILSATNSNAVCTEGVLKIIPLGDTAVTGNGVTWTPNMEPEYDLTEEDFIADNSNDPITYDLKRPADAWNYVQVQYRDRSNQYNEQVMPGIEPASIDEFGLHKEDPVSLHCICDSVVAGIVAQMRVQRTCNIRTTYKFRLGPNFCLLEPLDLVTVTSARLGLDRKLVRLLEIDEEDDGELSCTAEETLVGIAMPAESSRQAPAGWENNTDVAPGNVTAPLMLNPPRALTDGGLEVWVAVAGGTYWGGAQVWVSLDGVTYQLQGLIDTPARYGVTTSILASHVDPDMVNTVGVDLEGVSELLSATDAEVAALVTICALGSEVVAYKTATLTGPSQYTLGGNIRRGLFGTTPASQASGSPFMRLDGSVYSISYRDDQIGSTIYVKFLSFNVYGKALQELSDVTAYTVDLTPSGAPFTVVDWENVALRPPALTDLDSSGRVKSDNISVPTAAGGGATETLSVSIANMYTIYGSTASAATSAAAAAASASAATTAKNLAETARDAAQAAYAAADAAQALASGYAGNAATSSTAASSAASAAAASQTAAAASQTASAGSATAAAASQTAAAGSASAAASSATSAASSATSSGTSATASEASRVEATAAAAATLPYVFDQGDTFWSYENSPTTGLNANYGSPATYTTVSGVGYVLVALGSIVVSAASRGRVTLASGRTHRITARKRLTVAPTVNGPTARLYYGVAVYDSADAYLGSHYIGSPAYQVSDSWQTLTGTVTTATILSTYPTAVYLRPMSQDGWDSTGAVYSGATTQTSFLRYEDATESTAAGVSATASATSASAASASQSAAASSASAASSSETNAATSAASASTYAANASTSATSAAGSASTATTQAGIATSAASDAAGSASGAASSATAAAGSASAAASSATAAGSSATSATASANTATTQAANAATSASAAATSASGAASSQTAAASSASAAQASSVAASVTAMAMLPDRYLSGVDPFTNYLVGSPASVSPLVSNATDSTFGPVYDVTLSSTTSTDWGTIGVLPATPGTIYEMQGEVKRTAGADGFYYLQIRCLDATYSDIGGVTISATLNALNGSVQSDTAKFSNTASTGVEAWLSGTVWIRPYIRTDSTGATLPLTVRQRRITLRDVTSQVAAAGSATAAASSASSASASQTAAASSASAASTSATNAATSAGGAASSASSASTSASAASSSASNAAGSASAAATSATTSATAAGAALRDAAQLLPSTFAEDGRFFSASFTSPLTTRLSTPLTGSGIAYADITSPSYGRVLSATGELNFSTTGQITLEDGQTYEGTIDFIKKVGGTGTSTYYGATIFDASQTVVGYHYYVIGNYTSANDSEQIKVGRTTTAAIKASWPTAVYVVPFAILNYPQASGPTHVTQVKSMGIRNVTALAAAEIQATAAASSASSAAASQTAAGSSASAAATSATNAATSASAASTSAGSASTSATNAAGSASSAATSASVSASARDAAAVMAASTLPDRYLSGVVPFTAYIEGDPATTTPLASNATDGSFGAVYDVTLSSVTLFDWATLGLLPATAGVIYEVEGAVQRTAGTGGSYYLQVRFLDASYTSIGGVTVSAAINALTGSVQTDSGRISNVASTGVAAWDSGTVWLRPYIRNDSTGATFPLTVRQRRLTMRNVTGPVAAAASATAAASSASSASASASGAATSASTATTQAGIATTQAASAATSAGSAATSATNAAGSASSASSYSTLAASARDASQNAAAATLPFVFDQGDQFWVSKTSPTTGLTAAYGSTASYATVSGVGYVLVSVGSSIVPAASRGRVTLAADRTHRVTARKRLTVVPTVNGPTARMYFGVGVYDSADAHLAGIYIAAPAYQVSDGWQTITGTVTTATILGTYPTAVYIRPMFEDGWDSTGNVYSGATIQTSFLRYEDVTEGLAAAGSATAAATSASSAAASSTSAGTYASSATTSANTATTQAGNASTSASSASSSAAAASSSASAATASATLSATVGLRSLNLNPVFAAWANSGSFPDDWSDYDGGAPTARVTGVNGGYAHQKTVADSSAGVMYQPYTGGLAVVNPGWYVLEAEVKLVSGSLRGAGVLFGYYDAGPTNIDSTALDFYYAPDNSGTAPGVGTAGKLYRFSKLVQAPAGTTQARLYCATNASWLGGGTYSAKTLEWQRCSVRPATDQEIASNTATANISSLTSSVSTNSSAIADVNGRLSATYAVTVGAGNRFASFKLLTASGGGTEVSSFDITADKFRVYNGTSSVAAFEVSGGVAYVGGSMVRTASMETGAVQRVSFDQTSGLGANCVNRSGAADPSGRALMKTYNFTVDSTGKLKIFFLAQIEHKSGNRIYCYMKVTSVASPTWTTDNVMTNADAVWQMDGVDADRRPCIGMNVFASGLTPGSHTVEVYWNDGGSGTHSHECNDALFDINEGKKSA